MTSRDRDLVAWVARFGAAGVDDLRVRFGLGRTVAFRRVAACIDDGLLDRVRLVYGSPALLVATRRGLRWAGARELGTCHVNVATFAHWVACGRLAAGLESAGVSVWSERELRFYEREAGRLIASAEVERQGERRVHRPDLVLWKRGGELPVAVEVELSVKASRRLAAICRGWARARHVAGVRYYALPEPARAVARAVESCSAQDVIEVRRLEPVLAGGRS